MGFYQQIVKRSGRFISKKTLFKYGFNFSPMYRRSTARIIDVSEDVSTIKVRLKISWKNKNYMGSIFGGSMFSAVDPIPMIQLINLLDDNYIIWDKSVQINFKRPAREHLYASFEFAEEEIEHIKQEVAAESEIEYKKKTLLTNKDGTTIYCEIEKTLYIANKAYYKKKRAERKAEKLN